MRKTVARVALVLLVLSATLAFGDAVRAPGPSTSHSSTATSARIGDDVHAMAAMPARSVEWASNQQRGPQGNDRLVAVLLAVAVSVVAQAWRRASFAPSRSRAGLGGHRAPSRAPPAFV